MYTSATVDEPNDALKISMYTNMTGWMGICLSDKDVIVGDFNGKQFHVSDRTFVNHGEMPALDSQ